MISSFDGSHSKVELIKRWIFVVPVVAMICLIAWNIILSSSSIDFGTKLRNSQKQHIDLVLQHKQLEVELAESYSLHALQEQALAEGYVLIQPSTTHRLTQPVALR